MLRTLTHEIYLFTQQPVVEYHNNTRMYVIGVNLIRSKSISQ